jgi:hypothetical protein
MNATTIDTIAATAVTISITTHSYNDAHHTFPSMFASVEDYLVFKHAWKHLAKIGNLTPAHMAVHAILMSRSIDAAFAPITNPVKLANGQAPYQGRNQAILSLRMRKDFPLGLSKTGEKYHAVIMAAATALQYR